MCTQSDYKANYKKGTVQLFFIRVFSEAKHGMVLSEDQLWGRFFKIWIKGRLHQLK